MSTSTEAIVAEQVPAIRRGIIAVVRTASAATALTLGRGFSRTGVAGIEITMTVPGATGVIARLVAEGVERVGAGTIRTIEQLEACAEAGAAFVVSPHFDPVLVERAVHLGVPAVPGTLTPSEMVRAMSLGAAAVKLFPVSAIGGHRTVRALLEPLPDARIVVSGEVSLSEAPSYFAAGAWAVCVGPSLWSPEITARNEPGAVQSYAQHALDISGCTAVIEALPQ